jgi:hypothetical protein
MNAVTRTRPGHWSDSCRDLTDGDRRVSLAEQQDYQIPVGEPAAWQVIVLCLSPLIVIGGVSLIAFLIRT